jgi:hypothetical protein
MTSIPDSTRFSTPSHRTRKLQTFYYYRIERNSNLEIPLHEKARTVITGTLTIAPRIIVTTTTATMQLLLLRLTESEKEEGGLKS